MRGARIVAAVSPVLMLLALVCGQVVTHPQAPSLAARAGAATTLRIAYRTAIVTPERFLQVDNVIDHRGEAAGVDAAAVPAGGNDCADTASAATTPTGHQAQLRAAVLPPLPMPLAMSALARPPVALAAREVSPLVGLLIADQATLRN